MDEREWLASSDPQAMLRLYISDEMPWPAGAPAPLVSDRKLRLFAQACESALHPGWLSYDSDLTASHAHCGYPPDEDARLWASLGPESPERAALLRDVVGNPFRPITIDPSWRTSAVLHIAEAIYRDRAWPDCGVLADALEEAGCADAECETCEVAIQGEKGRATLKMAGLTTTLGGASKKSYLPGCLRCGGTGRVPNPLLAHLRSPGPHARGCHVVDALTGRG